MPGHTRRCEWPLLGSIWSEGHAPDGVLVPAGDAENAKGLHSYHEAWPELEHVGIFF